MEKYDVTISGTMPLLWNRMKRELALEQKGLKKNELDEWENDPKNWLRRAELDIPKSRPVIKIGDGPNAVEVQYPEPEDGVVVPATWLRAMIIAACKHSKIVPHFASRKSETYTRYAQSLLVEVTDDHVCKVEDLVAHGSYVVINGSRIYRVRPMLENWTVSFRVVDPFGRMAQEELEQILDFGGYIEGIGDGRTINMGRFETIRLEKVKPTGGAKKRGRPKKNE